MEYASVAQHFFQCINQKSASLMQRCLVSFNIETRHEPALESEQSVERILGKGKVVGSIPTWGSR